MREQAHRQNQKLLYRFLEDGNAETGRRTYMELDQRARAVAVELLKSCSAGERALLLYPPGLEFIEAFFGCLYAGIVAVPGVPPRSKRGLPRLSAIARDSRPSVVLTTEEQRTRVERLGEPVPELSQRPWVSTDHVPDQADLWTRPDLSRDSLAFLQYTSGSTGDPKGVRVTHGNLLANEEAIRRAFGQDEHAVVVGWLPLFHDMGLIGNVLQPLFVGATCHLMPPLAFLQKPIRWLRTLSRVGGTTSGGPDFAYELCIRKIPEEERRDLDLSSWRVAFSGAEPVRSATLDRFAEAFAPCGFRREAFLPCYGLAEATLLVSGHRAPSGARSLSVDARALKDGRIRPPRRNGRARSLVSCGEAVGVREIEVVSPDTKESLTDGRIGELWVAGESVADGYWGRSEETHRTFQAFLADGRGPFLRTGDLGFLDDGEVVVAGRLKDLIILRGRNVYPHDVEAASTSSHEGLSTAGAAAFSVDDGKREALVIVQEVERTHRRGDLEGMAEAIRRRVVEDLEVEPWRVALVAPGQVPRTTSGKIRRSACRQAWLDGDLTVLHEHGEPSTATFEDEDDPAHDRLEDLDELHVVLEEATRILGWRPDPDEPMILDSLKAMELASRLEECLGSSPPLARLLGHGSPEQVAEGLAMARQPVDVRSTSVETCPGEEPGSTTPSEGQRALWFLERLAPVAGAYHVAAAVRLPESVTPERVERSFRALAERHEALRTVLPERDGEPVRRVLEDPPLPLEASPGPAEPSVLAEETERPFDLESGPLYRLRWFDDPDGSVLLLVFHHAVVDLTSLVILARDLSRIWSGDGLPASTVRYGDFVRWQQTTLDGPSGERLLDGWAEALDGAPDLELPADRPRPREMSFRGATEAFSLPAATCASLEALGQRHRASPFVVLLAGFSAFLSRLSRQPDLVVGAPVSGRTRPELRDLVGYLTQPLPLRLDVSGDPSFEELIRRARRVVTGALEHQELSFPRLVERLAPERDPARSPLFQVMLAWQASAEPSLQSLSAFAMGREGLEARLGDVPVRSVAIPRRRAQFDLSLHAAEGPQGWIGVLEYATDLFDATTIRRWSADLERWLTGCAAEPGRPLSQSSWLSTAQRHQILREWNDPPGRESSSEDTLAESIRRTARRAPDAVAVRLGSACLSYGELVARADALARRLVEEGVSRDAPVAVLLDRSLELAVALVGILEAGAAYVPLSLDDPPARWADLLQEIRPAAVLAEAGSKARLDAEHDIWRTLSAPCLDPADLPVVRTDGRLQVEPSPVRATPAEGLAYILFTSGSTGRPKAVAVAHRGIVNRLRWMQETYGLESGEPVLQKTPLTFDVSVWELFWPLSTSATLVFAEPGAHRDPSALRRLVVEHGITTMHFVPSVLQLFVEEPGLEDCRSLTRIVASGEALSPELARRTLERFGPRSENPLRLDNLYGPTEASVDVSFHPCRLDALGRTVPIGRPVRATRLHVVEAAASLAPIGVAGELCLSGVQLARGYLGRPRQTAARFVPDPFAPTGGQRAYRTGDLARQRPDGALEFLGRLDHQVKIRGVRVEPGEVAAVLESHPAVREAVVLAVTEPPRDPRLAAWVLPAAPVEPQTLLRHAAARLPRALVPSTVSLRSAWPLHANGKLDRRALEDGLDTVPTPASTSPPQTAMESRLAMIWRDLLALETVPGRDASFFDLGGHSLMAARLVARIRRDFQVELTVAEVFQAPTLAIMAERVEAAETAAGPPLERAPAGASPVASFAQERLWFLDRLDPGATTYHMPAVLILEGSLSTAALSAALRRIVERHEVLRTRFPERRSRPAPDVSGVEAWSLPCVDLGALEPDDRARCAYELGEAVAQRPFDLAGAAPVRFRLLHRGASRHDLSLCLHHAVADGWSLGVFLRELSTLYRALIEGRPDPLPALTVQYADFAAWQRRRAESPDFEERLEAYAERLRGAPTILDLPSDGARSTAQTFRSGRVTRHLTPEQTGDILHRARAEGVTPFMLVATVLALWLGRWSGRQDFLLGTPVAGRPRPELEGLIGLFVEPVVLRADLSGSPDFRQLLHRVREASLAAFADQDLPFERLVEKIAPDRDPSRTPLFQVFFNWLDAPLEEATFPEGIATRIEARGELPSKFDLTLYAEHVGETIRLDWVYDADLFTSPRMEEAARQLELLLEQAVEDPEAPAASYSLVTTAAAAILPEPEAVVPSPRRPSHVLDRLRNHDRHRPDHPAIEGQDGSLTYRELLDAVEDLGAALRRAGIGREDRVLVWAHRHRSLPVALLGAWQAHAGFVILDPAYPEQRLLDIVEQVAPSGCIRLASAGKMPAHLERRVMSTAEWTLDAEGRLEDSSPAQGSEAISSTAPGPEDLAYVAFTSGSTGRPKGIEGEHGPISAFLAWQSRTFGLGPDSRGSLWSGLSHDPLVRDVLAPLWSGGTVCIPAPRTLVSPQALRRWTVQSRITVANATPALLEVLTTDDSKDSASEETLATALRWIFIGGDTLTRRAVERVQPFAPYARYVNVYGATETPQFQAWQEVESQSVAGDSVPLGRGIEDVDLLIRNGERLCGIGELGEIHVRSPYLARGYLGDPETTLERFRGGAYATGDRGRYLPDGRVAFAGRGDLQVSVRGFRVELAEIEAVLAGHPGVAEAVVALEGDRTLTAHLVTLEGRDPSVGELRRHLGSRLPSFMVPSHFVRVESLPRDRRGKIDRAAVARLAGDRMRPSNAYVEPSGDVERTVAEIWCRTLGVDQVGAEDNFFEIGGTSMLSLEVISAIRSRLDVELSPVVLFEAPTVRALSRRLDAARESSTSEPSLVGTERHRKRAARRRRLRRLAGDRA